MVEIFGHFSSPFYCLGRYIMALYVLICVSVQGFKSSVTEDGFRISFNAVDNLLLPFITFIWDNDLLEFGELKPSELTT